MGNKKALEGQVQCMLGRGSQATIALIPARFAQVGKRLDLKDKKAEGGWDRDWQVLQVYDGVRLSDDYVREHEDDYRTQRDASDI